MENPKGGKNSSATKDPTQQVPFHVVSWVPGLNLLRCLSALMSLHSSVCSQQHITSEKIGQLPPAFSKEPENLYFSPISTQDRPNTPQQLSTYATICSFLIKLKTARAGRFDGDRKELCVLQQMGWLTWLFEVVPIIQMTPYDPKATDDKYKLRGFQRSLLDDAKYIDVYL